MSKKESLMFELLALSKLYYKLYKSARPTERHSDRILVKIRLCENEILNLVEDNNESN